MKKQRVLLTGASGGMGFSSLKDLLKDSDIQDVVVLVRPSEKNKKMFSAFKNTKGLVINWGDLTNYKDIYKSIEGVDIILHVGAFVSPSADDHPETAMKINFGAAKNFVRAIKEQNRLNNIKFVNIGTIAETGDRMPPIHWGRIGDPIKPSVYDYYAVSKIAAERHIIESGIKNWVSLRQTGITGKKMLDASDDPIQFHNPNDNVLEYVSDRDSARLMRNLCRKTYDNLLPNQFWGHCYNIGGGKTNRKSGLDMNKELYSRIGIKNISLVRLDPKYQCIRNFHGTYYLDSDILNDYLDFRRDSIQYLYDCFEENMGKKTVRFMRFLAKIPGGQRVIGSAIKKRSEKIARKDRGPISWEVNGKDETIAAFYGSVKAFNAIKDFDEQKRFKDWNTVVHIDHGYDESKPESELTIEDVKGAAKFRGGECLSDSMIKGDWTTKLRFSCAFGHEFEASPRLVLEAGHWCPTCESKSWNYYDRAKVDPFFAQVWTPLRDKNEKPYEYKKVVTEQIVP